MSDPAVPSEYRALPQVDRLPCALYRAAQVRELDRTAIEGFGIPGEVLMERAGTTAYRLLRERWPDARDLTVVCGVGNNGGDGYVVARLALQEGLSVRVLQLGDPARLQGDALRMADAYRDAGGAPEAYTTLPRKTDLIVDAVLGTGLERPVTGPWAEALVQINAHPAPVLAIDIPSGLHSDTGEILGVAVEAAATISFIGLKQGMFTGSGPDCCGEIRFDGLSVPAAVYGREIVSARRIDWDRQSGVLRPRRRTAHKGDMGHVLVIGGAPGFSGAARMAAEAAARTGAGLVSVATHPGHAAWLNLGRPELMCHGVEGAAALQPLLARADAVALGPGLGQSEWGRELYDATLDVQRPLVMDADALNLLARAPCRQEHWVLTPHPGEAARLLRSGTNEVQRNRFFAAERIQDLYGGVVVLKGAGTIIHDGSLPPAVCSQGNPGMASGGMGDVLPGILATFLAQGFEPEEAACMGVCLHAAAADTAAREGGERGLLATDLFPYLRRLGNP